LILNLSNASTHQESECDEHLITCSINNLLFGHKQSKKWAITEQDRYYQQPNGNANENHSYLPFILIFLMINRQACLKGEK